MEITQNTGPVDYYPAIDHDGVIEEIACPGVHSDIGGGYSSSYEHDAGNNQLARIPLHIMYQKALQHGVPFWDAEDVLRKVRELTPELWNIDPVVQAGYDYLMDHYSRYTGLRRVYKQYREVELTLLAQNTIKQDQLPRGSIVEWLPSFYDNTNLPTNFAILYHEGQAIKREIDALMGGAPNANTFLATAGEFYHTYSHKSCYPWNTTTGMHPEYREIHYFDTDAQETAISGILHRSIFFPYGPIMLWGLSK